MLDLKRVAFADFELNALPGGKTRYLTRDEYHTLREYLKESE